MRLSDGKRTLVNQMNGAVILPHMGREDAWPEGLQVFLRQYNKYAKNLMEMGGSGAGSEWIRMRCLFDRAYPELVVRDHLKKNGP